MLYYRAKGSGLLLPATEASHGAGGAILTPRATGNGAQIIPAGAGGALAQLAGAGAGVGGTPSADYPNLMPGATLDSAHVHEFTLATMNSWTTDVPQSADYNVRDGSTYSPSGYNAPGAGPASPPMLGEILYPLGFAAGSAPAHLWAPSISGNGWNDLYFAITMKLSNNWYGNSSGTNKILIIWIHGNPCFILSPSAGGNSALPWQYRLQNIMGGAINLSCNLVAAYCERDYYERIEGELKANTPGLYDGIARLWLTRYDSTGAIIYGPTLVMEHLDVGWAASGQGTTWESVTLYPIWGGTSGTVPADQALFVDRIAYGGLAA